MRKYQHLPRTQIRVNVTLIQIPMQMIGSEDKDDVHRLDGIRWRCDHKAIAPRL